MNKYITINVFTGEDNEPGEWAGSKEYPLVGDKNASSQSLEAFAPPNGEANVPDGQTWLCIDKGSGIGMVYAGSITIHNIAYCLEVTELVESAQKQTKE